MRLTYALTLTLGGEPARWPNAAELEAAIFATLPFWRLTDELPGVSTAVIKVVGDPAGAPIDERPGAFRQADLEALPAETLTRVRDMARERFNADLDGPNAEYFELLAGAADELLSALPYSDPEVE